MTATVSASVASHRIAEEVRARILSGALPPGSRIKQDELADELETSRIPVREALRILEVRGLVEVRSNSGAWVCQMSLEDLTMSYRIRERIEPLLLEESMLRLGTSEVATMREIQARIEAAPELETFMSLDRELHWTSYGAHRSPQLAGIVERLWDSTHHYRREFARNMTESRRWTINAEHRLLIEALTLGDTATACDVLKLHIQRTRIELSRDPALMGPSAVES